MQDQDMKEKEIAERMVQTQSARSLEAVTYHYSVLSFYSWISQFILVWHFCSFSLQDAIQLMAQDEDQTLLELNGGLSDCQNDSLKDIYYYNFSKSINVIV